MLCICSILTAQNLVKDIFVGSSSSSPIFIGSLKKGLVFYANNVTTGTELCVTNGTSSGTFLLKDINPGTQTSFQNGGTYIVDSTIFLWVKDTSTARISLWKTDGTTQGTKRVKSFVANTGPSSTRSDMAKTNGKLVFAFDDGSGIGDQIWVSDGTYSGTKVLKYINGGLDASPSNLVEMGGKVYFFANSSATGHELWTTDGTEAGTEMVIDLMPGIVSSMFNSTNPVQLVASKNSLFLSAISDVDTGYELYVSDGTAAGTKLVKNLNTSNLRNASVQLVAGAGNFVIFSYIDNNMVRRYACSDGTAAGTFDFITEGNSTIFQMVPRNCIVTEDKLYFVLSDNKIGSELYSSDGTPDGTGLVIDLSPGTGSSVPSAFVNIDNAIYFSAVNNAFGRELWITTGKGGYTQLVTDFNPGVNSGNFSSMMVHNGILYAAAFVNNAIGNELYDFNTKILLNIDEIASSENSIYPNPIHASDYLNLRYHTDVKCKLYNGLGQLVFESNSHNGKIQMPENISSGIYTLLIQDDNIRDVRKLTIE